MWKNMEKSGRKNKEKSPKFSQLFVGRQTRRSAKPTHTTLFMRIYNICNVRYRVGMVNSYPDYK